MLKILAAVCVGGQVKVGETILQNANIVSQGVGDSEGIVFIDDLDIYYIPMANTDLKTTLEKIVAALTEVATGLTQTATGMGAIDVKPTGGTGSAPAPAAASNITNINSAVSQINTIKSDLNSLKDNLE